MQNRLYLLERCGKRTIQSGRLHRNSVRQDRGEVLYKCGLQEDPRDTGGSSRSYDEPDDCVLGVRRLAVQLRVDRWIAQTRLERLNATKPPSRRCRCLPVDANSGVLRYRAEGGIDADRIHPITLEVLTVP